MNHDKALDKLITELRLEGFSQYTIRNYTKSVRDLLNYAKKVPSALNEEDARSYLATLFDTHSRATTSLIASAIRYYYSEILNKPIGRIKIPKKERKLPEVLTQEEIDQVILAAPTLKTKLMIRLMYTTGLRVSELVIIKKQDIDFNTGRARIKGKGQKTRQISIPPNILAKIKTFSEDKNTFIFSDNQPLTTRNVQKILNRISKKLNINKKITPHTLRHSYATHLLEAGVDIRVIQTLLGHENLATTQIYTKVTDSLIKQAEPKIKQLERV